MVAGIEFLHPAEGKAADDGAKEALSAVKLGLLQVAAHTEDGADAGKGRTAARKEELNQCAQGGSCRRFDVAHTNLGH